MRTKIKQYQAHKKSKIGGSVLVLVAVFLVILVILGLGMLTVAYGVRHRASILKNEAAAMLAAEAGYEKATFEMGKQLDMLSALQQGAAAMSGTMSLPGGSFDYQITLFDFVRSRPVYRVIANGHSGVFNRTVDAYVIQAISGWDMGMCRVPLGGTSTWPVNFAADEILDMPIHINKLPSSIDPSDDRDIYILGSPRFLREVAMGESRYKSGGTDKYPSPWPMNLFEGGICFNQPDSRITDEAAVQMKLDRFRASTDDDYNFSDDTAKKPLASAPADNPLSAVQLEFFEDGGVGKVRITNNCTIRGFRQSADYKTWDFEIIPGTGGTQSRRYYLYAYHYKADSEPNTTVKIKDTYVTQSFGGVESEPAGQIFIDGDVIIGSKDYDDMVIKGKITVVAAKSADGSGGNIWIADRIGVSNYDDAGNYYPRDSNGMPDIDNPNILGLIAQGIIKVVDAGMTDKDDDDNGSTDSGGVGITPETYSGFEYLPIAQPDNPASVKGDSDYHLRHLPDPMEVEASMVIGGGGWGAVNVRRNSYGGRKEWSGSDVDNWDKLIVRGTIVECCRGVVGLTSSPEGFKKWYYFDERVLLGILPGDLWLQGKYVPAPSGWHDYRP